MLFYMMLHLSRHILVALYDSIVMGVHLPESERSNVKNMIHKMNEEAEAKEEAKMRGFVSGKARYDQAIKDQIHFLEQKKARQLAAREKEQAEAVKVHDAAVRIQKIRRGQLAREELAREREEEEATSTSRCVIS